MINKLSLLGVDECQYVDLIRTALKVLKVLTLRNPMQDLVVL